MAITYGFYNSLNGDRKYDAEQMGSLFDGIILDGVYFSFLNRFTVKATTGLNFTVDTGRAWFNHTWILNDAIYPMVVEAADVTNARIDAVVIDVNQTEGARKNDIVIVKGTPAASPKKPTMIKEEEHFQYPLAYITVPRNATTITQSNIQSVVGTSECPYVTGPLQVIDIDDIVAQWTSQWNDWVAEKTSDYDTWSTEQKEKFDTWMAEQQTSFTTFKNKFVEDMNTFKTEQQTAFETWTTQEKESYTEFTETWTTNMNNFQTSSKDSFDAWFKALQDQLDDNQAANLQNQITANAEKEFNHYYSLVNKVTEIKKGATGSVESIVETSDEAVCTTTFSQSGNNKVIKTEVVPSAEGFKYVKTVTISGNTITEAFTKEGK